MKKVLGIAALIGIAAVLFTGKKDSTTTSTTVVPDANDPLEGKIAYDAKGLWYYITGGKKYFLSQGALDSFQKAFPGVGAVLTDLESYPIGGSTGADYLTLIPV